MTMKITLLLAVLLGATACVDTDGERALVGAAGGAVVADVTGGSVVTGALIGAAGGALCDDAGICN